jgi:hypothetical protein
MVNTTKGSELASALLLTQYRESTVFKEYMAAFIDEMDLLFEQIERVYLGRFIENAVGTQLDIIGVILNENRNVDLPQQFFGFSDAGTVPTNVAPMADTATPSDGGLFRGEEQEGTENFALSDNNYRQLLLAKAYLSTQEVCSYDTAYKALAILLKRVPRKFELRAIADRQVRLELDSSDTNLADVSLITYFSRYLVPLGTSFTITRT